MLLFLTLHAAFCLWLFGKGPGSQPKQPSCCQLRVGEERRRLEEERRREAWAAVSFNHSIRTAFLCDDRGRMQEEERERRRREEEEEEERLSGGHAEVDIVGKGSWGL